MESKEEIFVKNKFKEYYLKNNVSAPERILNREFGIGVFKRKIVSRHLNFVSEKNLNDYLKNYVPLYISYSLASYKYPDRQPMGKKEFIQADMVFEFDADMLETPCKKTHDSWMCKKCEANGMGNIKKCDDCGEYTSVEEWFCPECIGKTQEETLKLLKVMQNDLGFEEKDLKANFSGNAGFHLHLQSDSIQNLIKEERIQLVDYLSLHNLNFEMLNFLFNEKELTIPSNNHLFGIQLRLVNEIKRIILKESPDFIAAYSNISSKKAQEMSNEKEKIIESLDKGALFSLFSAAKKNSSFWSKFFELASQNIRFDIDRQTSVDIVKLIRLPDSLHGSTGLKAASFPLSRLESFNAFKDGVVFSSNQTIKVFINKAPKFILGEEEFGPFENEEKELQEKAALYLVANGKATLT